VQLHTAKSRGPLASLRCALDGPHAGYPAQELAAVARELRAGPQADETFSPIRLDAAQGMPTAERSASQSSGNHLWKPVVGGALLVAGTAGVAAGWVLYAKRFDYRKHTIDLRNLPNVSPARSRPTAGWTLASAGLGSLALAASEPFWLPQADGVPWPAWVAGALGAGVTLTGIGFSLFGPTCDALQSTRFEPACSRFVADSTFGPMLTFHALPLLAAPLTYATRAWLKPTVGEVALTVETTPHGSALLSVHGAF
jgi:hypothetical protein